MTLALPSDELFLPSMQILSGDRHPLEIDAIAQSSESAVPRTLEETLPHFWPS
jgi:hypothetical protein